MLRGKNSQGALCIHSRWPFAATVLQKTNFLKPRSWFIPPAAGIAGSCRNQGVICLNPHLHFHHVNQQGAGSTLSLSSFFQTARNKITPRVAGWEGNKGKKKLKKKKSFILDWKSVRKYCPEGFSGMYKSIHNLSQSNTDIVLAKYRYSAAMPWHLSINFNIILSVYTR